MAVQLPTPQQIRELADEMGLDLTDADVESYRGLFQENVDAYNVVDAMPDHLPLVKYPRTPGYQPKDEENPYNAWYVKSEVKGASRGKLKGKTVVLKDNVMLAGVPMMNGASTLEGYVPDIDATVVTRLLDAGATIVGKARCEYFCMSGGSHTNAKGPVHNPINWDIWQEGPLPAVLSLLRQERSISRLVEIKGDPLECPPLTVEYME